MKRGQQLRNWLEIIGVNKSEVCRQTDISHSSLYSAFQNDKVSWYFIIKIHNYLSQHYEYNINDYFTDFPREIKTEVEKIRDREITESVWQKKYYHLLEEYVQLSKTVSSGIEIQNKLLQLFIDNVEEKSIQ